jgi:predicted ATPase
MEGAIANSRRGVRRWYHDYELLVVAETMLKAGRREEALALVVEALDVIEASGNRLFEAEAYRLRGACSSDAAEAEHWLARALDISQRQDARSLRLRAAMSLAEVRRDQQHPQEANDLLAGAYAEFTEGFGTADIVTAKHLLDQLRSSIGP